MSQTDERHGQDLDEDELHCSNCGVELDEDAALQDPPPSQCLQCECDSLRTERDAAQAKLGEIVKLYGEDVDKILQWKAERDRTMAEVEGLRIRVREAHEADLIAALEQRDQARDEIARKERLYRDEQIEHDATRDERDRLLREAVRAEEAEASLAAQQALLDEAQNIAHFNGAERDRLKDELTAEKLAHGDTYDRKVSAERELNKTLDLLECQQREHEAEIGRMQIEIESLVADEVISAGRAREIHGLSAEAQRALWSEHPEIYSRTELSGVAASAAEPRWAALTRLANRTYRCELIGDFAGWEINAIDELGAEYKLGSGPTLDAALDDAIRNENTKGDL